MTKNNHKNHSFEWLLSLTTIEIELNTHAHSLSQRISMVSTMVSTLSVECWSGIMEKGAKYESIFFTFRPRKWFSSSGLQELHDPKKLGSMSFREWGSKIFLDLECSRIRSTAAGSIKSHPRQSLKDLSLTLLSSKIIERSFGIFTNPISPSLSQESARSMGGNLTERGFKN